MPTKRPTKTKATKTKATKTRGAACAPSAPAPGPALPYWKAMEYPNDGALLRRVSGTIHAAKSAMREYLGDLRKGTAVPPIPTYRPVPSLITRSQIALDILDSLSLLEVGLRECESEAAATDMVRAAYRRSVEQAELLRADEKPASDRLGEIYFRGSVASQRDTLRTILSGGSGVVFALWLP